MIVGFSRYGTGRGSGPTQYLVDNQRVGREHEPPVVLRGDAEQTAKLIDSLSFKYKYTSGVLSFAPDETISSEQEQAIIDRFEKLAFAGLKSDQYNILWVRHAHAEHHELHFVTPRVELQTGKSFNIRPPGERTKQHFDDFRSEINARYGLADPTDPARARNVARPDHELKIAAQGLRDGHKSPESVRDLIDAVLSQRAAEGLISTRGDVVTHVKDLGFDVTRTGKDYITVSEPQSGQRWRLKGGLYAREFELDRCVERAAKQRERDYSTSSRPRASHYAGRVERHIAARAEYNAERYKVPEHQRGMDTHQTAVLCATVHRCEPLHRYLWRELGDDRALLYSDSPTTGDRQRSETAGREDPVHVLRGKEKALRTDRLEGTGIRAGRPIPDFKGVLDHDDRTRNTLVERIRSITAAIRETTARMYDTFKKLGDDVQAVIAREYSVERTRHPLERTSQALEQSVEAVGKAVSNKIDHEQSLTLNRERSR